MANLKRRNEDENMPTAGGGTWDPLRTMMRMIRDPFADLEMVPGFERSFIPSVEVKETDQAFSFRCDLPGVKEDDIEISVTGNRLSISGKREEEKREEDERYYAYERSYGSFSRSFTLPVGTDLEHVDAKLENGVLELSVPKKPEVQPKRITLGKGQQAQLGGGEQGKAGEKGKKAA